VASEFGGGSATPFGILPSPSGRRVIFEDMNPIWLRTMWEDGGTARVDVIEILISLAILMLRSRL
jgi:hypothetical protein